MKRLKLRQHYTLALWDVQRNNFNATATDLPMSYINSEIHKHSVLMYKWISVCVGVEEKELNLSLKIRHLCISWNISFAVISLCCSGPETKPKLWMFQSEKPENRRNPETGKIKGSKPRRLFADYYVHSRFAMWTYWSQKVSPSVRWSVSNANVKHR